MEANESRMPAAGRSSMSKNVPSELGTEESCPAGGGAVLVLGSLTLEFVVGSAVEVLLLGADAPAPAPAPACSGVANGAESTAPGRSDTACWRVCPTLLTAHNYSLRFFFFFFAGARWEEACLDSRLLQQKEEWNPESRDYVIFELAPKWKLPGSKVRVLLGCWDPYLREAARAGQ